MSALNFISSVEISSSQSTTNVDNIFSSTYDNYKIILRAMSTVGTSDTQLNARLIDNSGSVISDSEYDYSVFQLNSSYGFTDNKNTNWNLINRISFLDQSPDSQGTVLYVYSPYVSSKYTFMNWQTTHHRGGDAEGLKGIAIHKSTEIIRGIQFYDAYTDRPYNTGQILVYGVK